jgi:hypothetical protein
MSAILDAIGGWILTPLEWMGVAFLGRRRLRLTVHRAFFLPSGPECFFINATNLSRDREIEVTHIWIDTQPEMTPVLNPQRPLPVRLRPDETWETWFPVAALPTTHHDQVFTLARARLSTGSVIRSRRNRSVLGTGIVPGGPIRQTLPFRNNAYWLTNKNDEQSGPICSTCWDTKDLQVRMIRMKKGLARCQHCNKTIQYGPVDPLPPRAAVRNWTKDW